MKISIIGLGWFGTALYKAMSPSHEVKGSKQTHESAEALRHAGINAYAMTLDHSWQAGAEASAALLDADVFVVNIPPGMRSGGSAEDYRQKMESLVLHLQSAGEAVRVIFISSTGVFGDRQHEVNEQVVPEPDSPSGKALLWTEQFFTESFPNRCAVIRPAGLIGPGRHPGRFLAGRSGLKGQHHPVNLVHLDDLVALTRSVIEQEAMPGIYHAVAGAHPSKAQFYSEAAKRMNLPLPHFDPNDQSAGKRVDGTWSKNRLRVRFEHDDLHF